MIDITLLGPGDGRTLQDVLPGVFDLPLRRDLVKEFLDDPRHHLAVAVEGGRVVGFASAVHYVHPDKEPELWINEVGVAPAFRRKGIGRKLLGALLRVGAELGCREAGVLTERDNVSAIQLFRSMPEVRPPSDSVMFSFSVSPGGDEPMP
jgi:aminoglycoside 6'-N-acetyltransferase I